MHCDLTNKNMQERTICEFACHKFENLVDEDNRERELDYSQPLFHIQWSNLEDGL